VIALLARIQLDYLVKSVRNPRIVLALFALTAGSVTLATITAAAFITDLPLLFPPLAASAFILYHIPMAVAASPRNVLGAHLMAVGAGLLSRWVVPILLGAGPEVDPLSTTWAQVIAVAMAMGLSSVAMVALRCAHPPAAATATIAAIGFFTTPIQLLGFVIALLLLLAEAFVLNRVLGGIPFPLWRSKPTQALKYGALAGSPESGFSPWQRLSAELMRRRSLGPGKQPRNALLDRKLASTSDRAEDRRRTPPNRRAA
jgi:CBS-domain-containing membrane protein